jgi:hypothetical protein
VIDQSRRVSAVTGTDVGSGASRTLELVSDDHLPDGDTSTIAKVFAVMDSGSRIAFVGGSDSHTESKKAKIPNPLPLSTDANDYKVGLRGRTWAWIGADSGRSWAANSVNHPVRRSLSNGHTVASTGPLVLAQVSGALPGFNTTILKDSNGVASIPVRLDWPLASNPNEVSAANVVHLVEEPLENFRNNRTPRYVKKTVQQVPETVQVFARGFRSGVPVVVPVGPAVLLSETTRLSGTYQTRVSAPDIDFAEVVVKATFAAVPYTAHENVNGRCLAAVRTSCTRFEILDQATQKLFAQVAWTSPIYVNVAGDSGSATNTVNGTVTSPNGDPVGGAMVQVCGTACYSTKSGAEGRYRLVNVSAGAYAGLVYPPSERGDLSLSSFSVTASGALIRRTFGLATPGLEKFGCQLLKVERCGSALPALDRLRCSFR